VTVAKDHLHIFYDPVLNMYSAYSMPFFYQYPNALQFFAEGKKLCGDLENMASGVVVSPPSMPSKNADSDLDRILNALSIFNNKAQIRINDEEQTGINVKEETRMTVKKQTGRSNYYSIRDYVKSRYHECYKIVSYFGFKKETIEFMETIYNKQWDKAGDILTRLTFECDNEECANKIGKFIDMCAKVIDNKEVRE